MKAQRVEIQFPREVEFPDGWGRVLDSLIGMVCKHYESQNPTRVMWTACHGAKPIWREPEEPEWDGTTYQVDVSEREDHHGDNEHNPNRKRLRAEARALREKHGVSS